MVPRRPKYNLHPKYNPFLFRSKSFSLNANMTSYIFASLSAYFKRADRNVFKLAHTCYCCKFAYVLKSLHTDGWPLGRGRHIRDIVRSNHREWRVGHTECSCPSMSNIWADFKSLSKMLQSVTGEIGGLSWWTITKGGNLVTQFLCSAKPVGNIYLKFQSKEPEDSEVEVFKAEMTTCS